MVKLGIIGAMTVEVCTLTEKMQDLCITERAGMSFYEGFLESTPAVVVQCGVGKVNAAMCVQILCDCFGVSHVINTGVAGSLCTELDIGDFVISSDVMYHDFDCHIINPDYPVGQVPGLCVRAFPANEALISAAYAAADAASNGGARIGRVASGDQFICSRVQKEKIIEDTGALCTEMEGAAVAHAAWRNEIPFVVIRAISDKADDSAQMDYPTFEAMAAVRCASVICTLAKQFNG